MPVAAVEIEVSLQAYGKETKDGKPTSTVLSYLGLIYCLVIAICKKLDISVIAYS
jgi:hypothetical protein